MTNKFSTTTANKMETLIDDSVLLDHGGWHDGISNKVHTEMTRLYGEKSNDGSTWEAVDEVLCNIASAMEHGYALALADLGLLPGSTLNK